MTLIAISDLHLGAANSQTKKIEKVLKEAEGFDELVINGDLIDSNLKRLKKREWKILESITRLSRNIKVTICRGNHDLKSQDTLSNMLGIPFVDYYVTTNRGIRLYFEHGDQVDKFINENPGLSALADLVYNTLQSVDSTHTIAKLVKHCSKEFIKCREVVKKGVLEKGASFLAGWAIGSHVHVAEIDHAVGYINTGCFTEKPCTYLTFKRGEPKIEYI